MHCVVTLTANLFNEQKSRYSMWIAAHSFGRRNFLMSSFLPRPTNHTSQQDKTAGCLETPVRGKMMQSGLQEGFRRARF